MGLNPFFGGTYLSPQSGSAIYFDCVTKEQVIRDAEVTEFPVEQGANISDHYRVKLNEVKLEVFVSQEPIDLTAHAEGQGFYGAQTLNLPQYPNANGTLSTIAKAVVNPVGTISSAIGGLLDPRENPVIMQGVLQWAAPFDSLTSLLTALDAIRAQAGLVDVITKSWTYSGMVITEVTTDRDKETGTGTRMTIAFRKLAIVNTQQVAAPPIPALPKDTPPVPKGAQQPQDPGQMQSLASAGLTSLKSIFGGP